MMKLFRIIIALVVLLTFMLLQPCASHKIWAQMPHAQGNRVNYSADKDLQHTIPALPRKLKLDQEADVKTVGNKLYMPNTIQEEALPDQLHHKEERVVHAMKETKREWMKEADTSQFFTMDYTPVRKRRPIHNKFVPFAP